MIKEHYHYLESKKFQYFSFVCKGTQGEILKIVQFTLGRNGRWNRVQLRLVPQHSS